MTSWNWEHFSPSEMMCRCGCGQTVVDREFMDRLEALRADYGKAMPVTSGYRCPKHNQSVSSTGATGPHTTGRAVDIAVRGFDDVTLLICLARTHGFTGIGINQKGEGRFIHLDDLAEPYPRPSLWTY